MKTALIGFPFKAVFSFPGSASPAPLRAHSGYFGAGGDDVGDFGSLRQPRPAFDRRACWPLAGGLCHPVGHLHLRRIDQRAPRAAASQDEHPHHLPAPGIFGRPA
jgi:hypothetical protein